MLGRGNQYLSVNRETIRKISEPWFPVVIENGDTPTKVSQNSDGLIYDSDNSKQPTDESYNPKNEDRFSELEVVRCYKFFFLNKFLIKTRNEGFDSNESHG